MTEPRPFAGVLCDAIDNDKLVVVAITSKTSAAIESEDTAYGAGKSTFAMDLSFKFHHYSTEFSRFHDFGLDRDDLKNWQGVFDDLWYYPSRIVRSLKQAAEEDRRIPMGVWDDVQYTAGAKSGVSPPIQELVGRLTTGRPQIAVLVLTAPNVLDVSSPVRRLIQYEVIIPSRGVFEVQQVRYRKDFRNPVRDSMRLVPVEAGDLRGEGKSAFPALPATVKARYDGWRKDQNAMKDDRLIRRLEQYERTTQTALPVPEKPERNRMAPALQTTSPRSTDDI